MALRSLMRSQKLSSSIKTFQRIFGVSEFHFLSRNSALNSSNVTTSTPPTNSRPDTSTTNRRTLLFRLLSSEVKKSSFKTNYIPPSDSDSDDEESSSKLPARTGVDKPKQLPPPYDPFNKKPAIEDPEDPTNLQEIFHKMRTDGLMNSAAKMFDGLSKLGLTHEALQLFTEINEKGKMPDVIGHTAVIEAYCKAGNVKEAYKVYLRMLAGGVMPNAYTYGVLIKGMGRDGKMVGEGMRLLKEMVGKGMRVDVEAYVAVVKGLVKEGRVGECRGMVEEMRGKGVVVEEEKVREALGSKRGPVFRTVMEILFGK